MHINLKQRKNIFITILVAIIILVSFGCILYTDVFNHLKCERRGGFWGGTGMCYPIKDLALNKKNILGLKINIPEKENNFAKLSNVDQKKLIGFIEDSKIGEKTGGKVVFYVDKMKNISSDFEFIAPFDVYNASGEKYSYLGLFSFSKKDRETGYCFYEEVEHLDSYLVGQDIEWGENKISESGWYQGLEYGSSFNTVEQEYYNGEEKKEVTIDAYNDYPYFSLHKICEEVGQIVNKNRGDGKEYRICVWENGNQCDLNRYERRMCPRDGYNVFGLDNEAEIYAVINGANFYKDNTFYVSSEHNHCIIDDYFNGKCD